MIAETQPGDVTGYGPVVRRTLSTVLAVCFFGGMALVLLPGCSGLPSLAEQEQHIRNNDLVLRKLEPRAFVRAWGEPTYKRVEFMPFFGVKDGSLVPRSRLPLGEAPPDWQAGIDAGDALFLAYPDQGWLVVFLDGVFVYREGLPAEKLHELGRTWEHEDKFRTRLDNQPAP
ncbi:MAG TPA: hypothetical protein VKP13_08670 [Nitrospira sp.]|nr:hypothetical protein [Nitrospira sp.]